MVPPTSLDPFDPDYVKKNTILSLQKQADDENALRLQAFNNACIVYFREGAKAPVPVIPNKVYIDLNTGQRSESTWPGLVVPTLPPPVLSTGSPVPTTTVPDRTDQIIAMLKIMNDKLDRLLAGK